jgi:hypothetical protein
MVQNTERGGPPESPGRRMSEFIAALVKDPKNPPEVVDVTGFLGAAAESGRTRIYLDTTLQNYVEVMEDKILHVEPVEGGQLGLSHIFIAADAQVFPPEQPPRLDARTVFGGAVYQDYLNVSPGSRADIGVVPYGYPYTVQGPHCCPTYIYASPCDCPPTRIWNRLCSIIGCYIQGTVGPICPPPPTPNCPPPSTGPHCPSTPHNPCRLPSDAPDICPNLGRRPYAAMGQPMTPGAGMGAGAQQQAAFPPPTRAPWPCPPVSHAYHCASQFWRCGPPPSIGACPGGGFVPPDWGGGMTDPYARFGGVYDPYAPYQTGY